MCCIVYVVVLLYFSIILHCINWIVSCCIVLYFYLYSSESSVLRFIVLVLYCMAYVCVLH